MRQPLFLAALIGLASTSIGGAAHAAGRPYVVLQDDGTIENHQLQTLNDLSAIRKKLLALYGASGQELPEIMSVWTTFPVGGSIYGTVFDALASDVQGIGLESAYPPDGKLVSKVPPLRSVLWHNDVLQLPKRAALQQAPVDGFADYLFLLELSHNWGPALNVPGAAADELIGFPFHWSYWMDAGGSPAGGNVWKDNGDGTFSAVAADPKTIAYSKLDLYIMGLATAAEVPPFGVLEGAVPPAGITDPLWKGVYAAHSFPWFSATTPFTATATRRALTIDDVVTTNGTRDPAAGASPTSWKLGIVLLVSGKDTPASIDAARQVFDPVASSFAPAFHAATATRGTLDVVTEDPFPTGTGGAGGSGGGGGAGMGGSTSVGSTGSGGGGTSGGGCGCRVEERGPEEGVAGVLGLAVAALAAGRRRTRRR